MQREIRYDNLAGMMAELSARGITKVVLAGTREKRLRRVEKELHSIENVRSVEVLAYHDSTIYKCLVEDGDLDSLRELFEANGFSATFRNRNIT